MTGLRLMRGRDRDVIHAATRTVHYGDGTTGLVSRCGLYWGGGADLVPADTGLTCRKCATALAADNRRNRP